MDDRRIASTKDHRVIQSRIARALPAYGLIGASKAAQESLARHLAMELGNRGINAMLYWPVWLRPDSTRNFSVRSGSDLKSSCAGDL